MDLTHLRFLDDSINIVIEGRRILKWTYAFLYYRKKFKRKDLFE